jgi:hypothetical protein
MSQLIVETSTMFLFPALHPIRHDFDAFNRTDWHDTNLKNKNAIKIHSANWAKIKRNSLHYCNQKVR